MNSRERFIQTMCYEQTDRVPYFEEGIRDEVVRAWRKQGLPKNADLSALFSTDLRQEVEINLDPHPWPRHWPETMHDLVSYSKRLDPTEPQRLPHNWQASVSLFREQGRVVMLRVHHGFFLTLGVGDWKRFYEVMRQVKDEPQLIHGILRRHGELSAALTEEVLRQVPAEAVIFSEPIGGMHGPLISPRMYQDLVLSTYTPILEAARRHNIQTIIIRTYANARALLPVLLDAGINCLWACECNEGAMDYRDIRREFGRQLRLVGGVDLDALRFGKESIRREVEEKVPPLLASGGYIPLADGRVREEVPYEDYVYYRHLIEAITSR